MVTSLSRPGAWPTWIVGLGGRFVKMNDLRPPRSWRIICARPRATAAPCEARQCNEVSVYLFLFVWFRASVRGDRTIPPILDWSHEPPGGHMSSTRERAMVKWVPYGPIWSHVDGKFLEKTFRRKPISIKSSSAEQYPKWVRSYPNWVSYEIFALINFSEQKGLDS